MLLQHQDKLSALVANLVVISRRAVESASASSSSGKRSRWESQSASATGEAMARLVAGAQQPMLTYIVRRHPATPVHKKYKKIQIGTGFYIVFFLHEIRTSSSVALSSTRPETWPSCA